MAAKERGWEDSLEEWGRENPLAVLVLMLVLAAGAAVLVVRHRPSLVLRPLHRLQLWALHLWLDVRVWLLLTLVALVVLGLGLLAVRVHRWLGRRAPSSATGALIGTAGGRAVTVSTVDLRHNLHVMGAIGSGKTTALINLALGFIRQGHSLVFVDPKDGLAITQLLGLLPAALLDRVVLVRPYDPDWAVGLNLLEVLPGEDEELLADQTVAVFRRLLAGAGGTGNWGVRMHDTLRAGLMTLMRNPGTTICDLPQLFLDADARRRWTRNLHDPIGLDRFWAGYDEQKLAGVEPLMVRLRSILLRPAVRTMFGQSRSTIDLGHILDTGGVLLLDIPKGKVGEDVSAFLGSFFVARLWQVIQRRAAQPEEQRHPVALCLDEFQNFVGDESVLTEILAESRAYRVGYVLAHQYRRQMPEGIWHALEANTRTKVYFGGSADADKLLERLARNLEAKRRRQRAYQRWRKQLEVRRAKARARRLGHYWTPPAPPPPQERPAPSTLRQHQAVVQQRLGPDPLIVTTRDRPRSVRSPVDAEGVAAAALERWGRPRVDVEEALRRRLAVSAPADEQPSPPRRKMNRDFTG